jgi:hypothetical protein
MGCENSSKISKIEIQPDDKKKPTCGICTAKSMRFYCETVPGQIMSELIGQIHLTQLVNYWK